MYMATPRIPEVPRLDFGAIKVATEVISVNI